MSAEPIRCLVCGLLLWTGGDAKFDPCRADHMKAAAKKPTQEGPDA